MKSVRNRNAKRKFIKSIAAESLSLLLDEAAGFFESNPGRSRRYVKMAWNLVTRNKIRLTPQQKSLFCRKCLVFWKPGVTLKIAFDNNKNLFYYVCQECGYKRLISDKSKSKKTAK